MEAALDALRAIAEDTRLRILSVLRRGELTVTDLTEILGQSQPRVSRHLRLLVEAGLVTKHREGTWAFFRLVDAGDQAALLAAALATVDDADPVLAPISDASAIRVCRRRSVRVGRHCGRRSAARLLEKAEDRK